MAADLTVGFVLGFMRKALSGRTDIEYGGCIEITLQLMADARVIDAPPDAKQYGLQATVHRDNPHLGRLLVEAFHYLLHNGLITRVPDPPNFPGKYNLNAFLVTVKGQEWAQGGDLIPEDVAGFMKGLNTSVPNLDSVIEQYVQEALVTYERRAYFAAAVMIGAASEKAVYLLAEALECATQDQQEKKRLANAMQKRGLPDLFKAVSSTLQRAKKLIPYPVQEGATEHMLSFFEAIRVQRNDAVHPAAANVTPDKVYLSIAAFPNACKKEHDLVDWLKANKI